MLIGEAGGGGSCRFSFVARVFVGFPRTYAEHRPLENSWELLVCICDEAAFITDVTHFLLLKVLECTVINLYFLCPKGHRESTSVDLLKLYNLRSKETSFKPLRGTMSTQIAYLRASLWVVIWDYRSWDTLVPQVRCIIYLVKSLTNSNYKNTVAALYKTFLLPYPRTYIAVSYVRGGLATWLSHRNWLIHAQFCVWPHNILYLDHVCKWQGWSKGATVLMNNAVYSPWR